MQIKFVCIADIGYEIGMKYTYNMEELLVGGTQRSVRHFFNYFENDLPKAIKEVYEASRVRITIPLSNRQWEIFLRIVNSHPKFDLKEVKAFRRLMS